ncbi:GNAT family N-acetyltransferase [Ottowia thiooxydans]|uniref:Ribosomal protein S18 acetylase RimI-like enzyme n=1 Tax=Ottowia thiooxydans TaxID=219182 RepID=A0ABV2Q4C1_9BURK
MTTVNVRKAQVHDLPHLLKLEHEAFSGDCISRRSWIGLLRSQSALVLVAAHHQSIVGAAIVLTRKGSAVARLYSIAVEHGHRRSGIGRALISEALACAGEAGSAEMRLESRSDNPNAHRLFRSLGFESFGRVVDRYYEDGMSAVRFRKVHHCTVPQARPLRGTPSSTGGPSSPLMDMKALTPEISVANLMALQVWNKATLVVARSVLQWPPAVGISKSTVATNSWRSPWFLNTQE